MVKKIIITLSNGRVINGEVPAREVAKLIDRMSSKKNWVVTVNEDESEKELSVRVKDVYCVEVF